jgi:hypothetical protein
MTFEPGRLGRKAYRTKVVMKDGKAFSFTSLSWRSLIEAEQLTQEYRAFTQALFEAVQRANPNARFIAGKPWWLWLSTTILGVACLLGMAFLIWQAVQRSAAEPSAGLNCTTWDFLTLGHPSRRLKKLNKFPDGHVPGSKFH